MTRAEDLLKALNGLRNAADNELSGEAYDVATRHIKGLFRLADFDGEDTGEGTSDASIPFAQAIAEVRTQAEGEMSGNAFYLASKSLDDLANLSSSPVSAAPPQPVTEPAPEVSEPVSQTPAELPRAEAAPAGLSFADLAAASKARVEEAAASLGLEVVHHHESTLQEYHEALELEKRSSEPCSMPEIVPIAEKEAPLPVTSAETPAVVDVIEAASAREVAEATHDFGIPAAVAGPVPDYAAPHEEPAPKAEPPVEFKPEPVVAAKPAPEPAPEPAPAPSVVVTKTEPRPAAPEVRPVAAVKKTDAAPKQHEKEPEKTFFSLWLDMVFGRRK